MDLDASLHHVIGLLLSPLEEPFLRYLDVCDDVHARDGDGNTLLHWAAALGNFSAAYALLQRGVAVDTRNAFGASALLVAAALCPNVATLGYALVSHGASLADSGSDGVTVQAVLEGRQLERVWRWLLECEQGLCQDDDGIHLVAFCGRNELPAQTESVVTRLLCSPTRLQQLRRRGGETSSGPAGISVPRAPPRQTHQPPQGSHKSAWPTDNSEASAPSRTELRAQIEVLASRETAGRMRVERDQLESFLYLYAEAAAFSFGYYDEGENDNVDEAADQAESPTADVADAAAAAVVGHIASVLGERIDANGRHHLLVRYTAPRGVEDRIEAWHLADSIASDPVVRAHLERTYSASADISAAQTPSIMTMHNVGSPLETWERDQLEAQLQLLPHRLLNSLDSGSPLQPQSSSNVLVSPTVRTPNRGSSSAVTDALWKDQQQQQQHQLVSQSGSSSSRNNQIIAEMAPQAVFSSANVMQDNTGSSPNREVSSRRFAPQDHRLLAGAATTGAMSNEDEGATPRQLVLSDGWRGLRRRPGVPVDGPSTWPEKLPTPVSAGSSLCSSDDSHSTMASSSPAPSSVPTKTPTTYNGSSTDLPVAKENRRYLTASQKADYNAYLYGAALRVLQRQQQAQRLTRRTNGNTS